MEDNKNSFIGINAPGLTPYDFTDKKLSVQMYVSCMLARCQSMFKWGGLPDSIKQRSLELQLQTVGFSGICKAKGELHNFVGGLGGVPDVDYMPTILTVDNPALRFNAQLKIGKECVIIPNDSMYMGLLPMFRRYATAMVENDLTMKIYDVNARIQALISAPDSRTKDSAEEYLRKIEEGKTGVIAEGSFFDGVKTSPMANSGGPRMTDLIEYHQFLQAGWYRFVGLQSNYNMKREAINGEEAGLDNDPLIPLIDDMLENRKKFAEEVNKLFGTSITVDVNSVWEKRMEEGKEIPVDRKEVSEEPKKKEDDNNE